MAGPGIVAHTYLEGSYTERYPAIERSRNGLQRLFRQFSWPYGIPSHVSPETPGSIHEGGELGYSLAHAYGAAFDNPDLIVACVIGDGEAETGALAASWHSNKFLNPARDGAVLPILHLNGFKIANPTVLARISREELTELLRGYGYEPHFVEGNDPALMHQSLAATLDSDPGADPPDPERRAVRGATDECRASALADDRVPHAQGLDGPEIRRWHAGRRHLARASGADRGLQEARTSQAARRLDAELSAAGTVRRARQISRGIRRARADRPSPHGLQSARQWRRIAAAAVDAALSRLCRGGIPSPASVRAEATRVLGTFLRDVMKFNLGKQNFRLFGPDETASNRLEAVYEVSGKEWMADVEAVDIDLSVDGRVMEVLSEHLCEGWLEGYLLTGRHGLFSCYEAFIHIIDSMFNQHAKWLKVSKEIPWRKPIASLNYLLTSHVWRQDHNGFSHQDPGFIDHVANKKADIVRIYLPPDANCLLSVADHCLRSRNYINLIVAGKQPEWQWLDIDSAVSPLHRRRRHLALGQQ